MPISINLTGVKTQPTPLSPGYYQASVSLCEQRQSQDGNPYIAWQFVITEGEFAGKKAFHNTSLLPQSLWSFKKLLVNLGFEEDSLAGQIDFDPAQVLTLPCTLVVVESEWQGETRGRVAKVLPAGVVGAQL